MSRTLQLLLAALITTSGASGAQIAPVKLADSIGTEIDRASQSGDLSTLRAARALAERVAAAYPNDGLILHYEGFALFREAGALLAQQKGSEFASLERAQTILERSLTLRPLPETYAVLSSIRGQLIGKYPARAAELGLAAGQSLESALAADPANPRVWFFRGLAAIYTPVEYGGGLLAAVAPLKRAIDLFGVNAPSLGEPTWGKAEAHLWLGQVYEKLGDKSKAASEYAAALQVAPEFVWARALNTALR